MYSLRGNAQLKFFAPTIPRDTSYIFSYYDSISLRSYVGKKYTYVQAGDPLGRGDKSFAYRPNRGLSVGVGGVYKIYSINLGVGIPMPNERVEQRGKSSAFDLQTTFWGRRFMYDVYAQWYRGFYLSNAESKPKDFVYNQRPDLRVRVLGGTAYYIFNPRQFSFRGTMVQDELPKKSKGTPLASFTLTRNKIESVNAIAILPASYEQFFSKDSIFAHTSYQAGLGFGYAYQQSVGGRFFTLLSVSARAVFDYSIDESKNFLANSYSFGPNATGLAGLGYSGQKSGFTLSFMHTFISSKSYGQNPDYNYNIGSAKLTFIYRISSTPYTRRLLKPLDNMLLQ